VVLLIQLAVAAAAAHRSPALAAAYAGCALAGAALLVLLRRHPGPAAAAVGATTIAALLLVPQPPAALLPFLLAVAAAVVRGARVWAIASAVGALVLPAAQLLLTADPVVAVRSLGEVVLLLAAVAVGEFARARSLRMRDLAAAAADRRRIAAEQERVRIARELHDVLAHSLSSITVQAGVGLHLAPERPEAATEALEAIRTASRDALDEVRGVLGILRGDGEAPVRPEPGIDDIAALVEETRRSGARIALRDELRPRPGRPLQLALYRIVQEALTNARRHAPGSAVEVSLERRDGAAVARIRDAGPAAPGFEPGNGITGMRERATLLGGTLDIGREDGWTVVTARIPDPAA